MLIFPEVGLARVTAPENKFAIAKVKIIIDC